MSSVVPSASSAVSISSRDLPPRRGAPVRPPCSSAFGGGGIGRRARARRNDHGRRGPCGCSRRSTWSPAGPGRRLPPPAPSWLSPWRPPASPTGRANHERSSRFGRTTTIERASVARYVGGDPLDVLGGHGLVRGRALKQFWKPPPAVSNVTQRLGAPMARGEPLPELASRGAQSPAQLNGCSGGWVASAVVASMMARSACSAAWPFVICTQIPNRPGSRGEGRRPGPTTPPACPRPMSGTGRDERPPASIWRRPRTRRDRDRRGRGRGSRAGRSAGTAASASRAPRRPRARSGVAPSGGGACRGDRSVAARAISSSVVAGSMFPAMIRTALFGA